MSDSAGRDRAEVDSVDLDSVELGSVDLEVVDLDAAVDEAAFRLGRACRELGFFRIPRESVPVDIADRAWDAARRFFDLPDTAKHAVGFPEPGYPYGWSPFGFESLSASRPDEVTPDDTDDGGDTTRGAGPAGDLKESFSVGPDCLGPAPPLAEPGEAWIRSPSRWPTEPAELQPALTEYFRAQSGVAARLLMLMAVALDLPPDHFESLIDRHTSALRALHYPPLHSDPAVMPAGARASAHSDYGTLTILRTDEVGGLEVESADGTWLEVVPRTDTYVVNLGDSIAQWTNDHWRSTVHRVSPTDSARRYSMAFFHMANWDATIECLPSCRSADRPPRYEPVKAGPWLMQKFQRTVT